MPRVCIPTHGRQWLTRLSIKENKENDDLDDWLWTYFQITVFFLPTHSPELNPIELLWQTLVQRLKSYHLNHGFQGGLQVVPMQQL